MVFEWHGSARSTLVIIIHTALCIQYKIFLYHRISVLCSVGICIQSYNRDILLLSKWFLRVSVPCFGVRPRFLCFEILSRETWRHLRIFSFQLIMRWYLFLVKYVTFNCKENKCTLIRFQKGISSDLPVATHRLLS